MEIRIGGCREQPEEFRHDGLVESSSGQEPGQDAGPQLPVLGKEEIPVFCG